MAEAIKVALEYIETSEGAEWIKTVTDSNNKERQIATLFGISKHAAKCYLKLVQPDYEAILAKLAEGGEYSLSKAYADSCDQDELRKHSKTDDAGNDNGTSTTTTATNSKDGETEDSGSDKGSKGTDKSAGSQPVNSSGPKVPKESKPSPKSKTPDDSESDEDPDEDDETESADDYLDKYPPKPLASKVILILEDGAHLDLSGEIQLSVNGRLITSTGQLQKLENGKWALPDPHVSFTLIVNAKDEIDDFFSDF